MKTLAISVFSAAIALSGAITPIASAQEASIDVSANANISVGSKGSSTSTEARSAVRGTAAASTSASTGGQLTAESHRSEVASFVQSLMAVADREGGIGTQVRVIARSQQDSASTSASAIAKVESRSKLRTIFLGSDYRSLGELRSEMATTSANIAKLKGLLATASSDADKAEISAQIQALEGLQVKIDAFVKAHESSFSLFGWLARMLSR